MQSFKIMPVDNIPLFGIRKNFYLKRTMLIKVKHASEFSTSVLQVSYKKRILHKIEPCLSVLSMNK